MPIPISPLFAQTASTPKSVMVHYVGQISCGSYIDGRAHRDAGPAQDVRFLEIRQWTSGFLTAYNLYVQPDGNIVGTPDLDGAFAWLDRYCREHPTEQYSRAAAALIEFLRRGH
jgi:hypothetical protein